MVVTTWLTFEVFIGIVRLDLHDDGPDIQGYLAQLTNQRTVPSIFISELLPYAISEFVFL